MRGQVATEYLIILAIVVVVSLIAVGMVRSMVTVNTWFNPAFSKIEWTAKDIILENTVIYQDGTAAIKIVNNANYPVVISKVGIGTAPVDQNKITMQAGETKTLTLKPNSAKLGNSGESYNLELEIIYYDADDPILQSSVKGSVSGVYQ